MCPEKQESLEYTSKKMIISRHSWSSKNQGRGLAEARQQYSTDVQNAMGLG